jgi:hypothetical protein
MLALPISGTSTASIPRMSFCRQRDSARHRGMQPWGLKMMLEGLPRFFKVPGWQSPRTRPDKTGTSEPKQIEPEHRIAPMNDTSVPGNSSDICLANHYSSTGAPQPGHTVSSEPIS